MTATSCVNIEAVYPNCLRGYTARSDISKLFQEESKIFLKVLILLFCNLKEGAVLNERMLKRLFDLTSLFDLT